MNEIENRINNKTVINDTNVLYDIDVHEEYENEQNAEEIENEEYSMKNIGDDDEINYDNENEDNYNGY